MHTYGILLCDGRKWLVQSCTTVILIYQNQAVPHSALWVRLIPGVLMNSAEMSDVSTLKVLSVSFHITTYLPNSLINLST
jgi:hypothetical protein